MHCWFGIDFDPDEREESIRKKIKYIHSSVSKTNEDFSDPYDGFMSEMKTRLLLNPARQVGKIPVEYWLTSKPRFADLITVANYVFFIDSNGCKEYATRVRDFVKADILPDIPMMIGVDHSSTGGAIEAVSQEYGSENLSLIILDSHFDAILPTTRCELAQYDLETNPHSRFKKFDPFILGRPESYNADSFVHYLVNSKSIYPENLVVLGVSDYPPRNAQKIPDDRVKHFVDSYLSYEKKGSNIVSKQAINSKGVEKSIGSVLSRLQTRYVYLSIDIDIGANSAHSGSRYLNVCGMSETQIYLMAGALRKILSKKGIAVVGFDVMETDVHRAGVKLAAGVVDRTYEIEANFASRLFPALCHSNIS